MRSTKTVLAASLLLGFGAFSLLNAAEVDARQRAQEQRIEQGVKSGELTKKEATHLEREHKAIHKEIKADRGANGGKLTRAEKRHINKQQNKVSKKIHRKKHNAAERGK